MRRLAIVASHPVQYQAPWFRALSREFDVTVFFCHRQDAAGQARAGFGRPFEWDVPLVEGYDAIFLKNVSRAPGVETFSGCDTPELFDRIDGGTFDACLVSGWYLKSYLQAVRAAWRAHVPVLMRGDSQLAGRRVTAKNVLKRVPYSWFLRRVDAHLYVGRANRQYLRHFGVAENRLFFTPHFIESDRFRSAAAAARVDGTAAALRQAPASPETTVFVFAGKLIEKKRPMDFVAGIARARATGADIRGLIVGAGPLEEAIARQAAASGAPVRCLGFRNQTEMPACYAAADGLVLPSDHRETWGLVVNEAMACGLPAIVSDRVGCGPDLIDPGRTGFIYPLGDVDALASRLLDAAGLVRDRRQEMASALEATLQTYSCARAVQGVREALDWLHAAAQPLTLAHHPEGDHS